MLTKLKKIELEIAVFLTGALVMIYEIVGSRILGPYFGTSTTVWTILIGVIMVSLAIGYYVGGKLSDRNPNILFFSRCIFLGACCVGVVSFGKDVFLGWLSGLGLGIDMGAFIAGVVLFLPASIILGMDSPYATRLRLDSMKNSGATIGRLSAISTLGSILGTFLAGFVLIPLLGTHTIVALIAIILILLSLFLTPKDLLIAKILLLVLICFSLPTRFHEAIILDGHAHMRTLVDTDTPYNRVWIFDQESHRGTIRTMGINNENHSSMLLGSNELVNDYTRYYNLGEHFFPGFQKTVILGGAGYSYPKYFLERYHSGQTIEVVEIDKKMTDLARQYFDLKDDPRLHITHEDGRMFLKNAPKNSIDVLYVDAFGSYYSIPYQLTTQEAITDMYNMLTESGVVITNIISKLEGAGADFIEAEYHTYASVFPHVTLYQVRDATPQDIQNIILVAEKGDSRTHINASNNELNGYLSREWRYPIPQNRPILTDDYAPVDYYMQQALREQW